MLSRKKGWVMGFCGGLALPLFTCRPGKVWADRQVVFPVCRSVRLRRSLAEPAVRSPVLCYICTMAPCMRYCPCMPT